VGRTVIRADGVEEDTLEDKDGDTKVQVEESSDEDKIRFDTAGTERMIITDAGLVGIGTSSPISELDVAGKISITSENSTPSQPADGKGYLYTKSDGKLYWRSYDLSETDLTAGGSSGISHDGSTADGVLTYKDADEATVESNMTFDGNTLTVSGNVSSNYVAILDNDQSSAGHVLKLLTDGNGSGSRILEMEDGDGDVVFRARADGRFGFGPDGVSSMGAGTFVVGIDNSSHTADIAISQRLQHLGDSNTYLDFPAADQVQIVVGGVDMLHITEDDSQDKIVFNEGGADVDFIIESPNETKALYLHAGNEVLHINHGESNFQTKIHNTNDLALTVNSTGVVLNDDGHATNDFRVESDNNDHMLFVDAGADKVGINDNDPISELSVAGKISITAESSTPSAPADGHGWLYTKSDGKIYWQSNDVSETDLTATGSGGSSSESNVTSTLTYDNAAFDLGTSTYTAKDTVISALAIAANKTITGVSFEIPAAWTLNSGTASGEMQIKIGDVWYKPQYYTESYGYISESGYWLKNHTTGIYGFVGSRQSSTSSGVAVTVKVKGVTNDTSNSGGYLTAGSIKITIYYT
tara:strand:- start:19131 stop:20879 length:1749 start_codon:yes stop_codon:yes gene_type:complete